MDFKNMFFYTLVISIVVLSFCIDSIISKIAYKKPIHLKEKSYSKIKNAALDMDTTIRAFEIVSKEDDDLKPTTFYHKDTSLDSCDTDSFESTTILADIKTTNNSPRDISCTCGIFLGSQFVKGSSEQPKGDPVLQTTLEHSFVCNPIGQKQCQTKCLEQIVQHLPNSANILCASLDRDIRKEKAFLFVRNCNKKWHNTNLAAGREYCCKNGLPYYCPKK